MNTPQPILSIKSKANNGVCTDIGADKDSPEELLAALGRHASPYDISQYLLSQFNIVATVAEGTLYIYDAELGYFGKWGKTDFPVWIHKVLRGTSVERYLTSGKIREIQVRLLAVSRQVSIDDFNVDETLLNVRNGVIDLKTGKLLQHDPKYMFLDVVNANYLLSECEPKHFNSMIQQAFLVEEDRKLFRESYAYLLSNFHSAKVCFFYLGVPHTGKSVLLRLLTELVGRENVANLPIEKFSERFAISTLYGKKVNICGEHEGAMRLKRTSVLKGLIGGDWIDAEPKGRPHFQFRAKTKCLFASNAMLELDPRIAEDALFTRFIFIGFFNPIEEGDRNPDFILSLLDERDAILTLLINVLIEWNRNGRKFTQTALSQKLMANFKGQKGVIGDFAEDCCEFAPDAYATNGELFRHYEEYCKVNCLEHLTPIVFIKELVQTYDSLSKEKHRNHEGRPLWGIRGIRLKEMVA